jgi:hypothetical protein
MISDKLLRLNRMRYNLYINLYIYNFIQYKNDYIYVMHFNLKIYLIIIIRTLTK